MLKSRRAKFVVAAAIVALLIGGANLFVYIAGASDRKPASNLPHDTAAVKISDSDFQAAENYSFYEEDTSETKNVTYAEFQKLPSDEQYTYELAWYPDDMSLNGTVYVDYVKNDKCRVNPDDSQKITCYEQLDQSTISNNKIKKAETLAAEQAGYNGDIYSEISPLYDKATDAWYAFDYAPLKNTDTYDWLSFKFNQDITAATIVKDGSIPTRTLEAADVSPKSALTRLSYMGCGSGCYRQVEYQVVNGNFYAVLYTLPGNDSAAPESTPGIYKFNSGEWRHLTPRIDLYSWASSDASGHVGNGLEYKIAQDGCAVSYVVKGQAYQLNSCEL